MRWFILILILSLLFLTGCSNANHFEKQPVLEQYILLRAENNINNTENSDYSDSNVKSSPH